MTSTLGFVLAAFLAFAPAPTGVEGARDLILLAEGRPIFLRLRVTTGDLPFDSSWLDSVRTLHACLDRDGDGKLTTTEAGADALAALVRLATGGAATLPRVELDVDPKDGGKVTRVGYKTLDNGKKVRVAKRSGEVIE